MTMRIALVTNIPSPYRISVWEELHKQIGSLDVFLCATTERNRVWDRRDSSAAAGVRLHVLPGVHWYVQQRDWGIHLNPGLPRALRGVEPDAIVVTGYDTPSYLLAVAYARRAGIPVVLWWGSHALSSRSRRGAVRWLRHKAVAAVSSYVTYGTAAADYLVSMGADPTRIVVGTNAVDVDCVQRAVQSHKAERSALPPSDGPVRFLYIGQFIERKGVRELIEAFRGVPRDMATLTLVGYGPLEQELRLKAGKADSSGIYFAGATRTIEDTARHYAAADVLIMPSLLEVWGLVVNEALAAGLYVLSSKYAGVTRDLVEAAPRPVGKAFDPADPQAFRDAILDAARQIRQGIDRSAIARWGASHTPGRYAAAIAHAVALAAWS